MSNRIRNHTFWDDLLLNFNFVVFDRINTGQHFLKLWLPAFKKLLDLFLVVFDPLH